MIRNLAKLYGDSDVQHITVRNIDIVNREVIFTWTNDSLPRSSECPKEHINRLLQVSNCAILSLSYNLNCNRGILKTIYVLSGTRRW